MVVIGAGCVAVEERTVAAPAIAEPVEQTLLARGVGTDPAIHVHGESPTVGESDQAGSDGRGASVGFLPEPEVNGRYSNLIVRTRARLRVGPEIPMRDINSIQVPEIPSLKTPTVRALGDDLPPVRPPLRQLWFHHRTALPAGYEMELRLSHGAFLAPDGGASLEPFRNTYAGLRDQALLHPAPADLPAEENRLPVIGPPPPRRAEKTFLTLTGLSVVGAAVYAFAPSSFVGGNKDGQWADAWGHFKEAWTKPPVFDKDPAIVNYLGHPWFGSLFYLSQRNYEDSPLRAFLFSTLMSTCFEYFVESWSERPSVNDLIVTPVVGSILGELIFQATREMRKDGFTTGEKVILTVINPLYVFQNGYR